MGSNPTTAADGERKQTAVFWAHGYIKRLERTGFGYALREPRQMWRSVTAPACSLNIPNH
ncbi:unnamed protein product [Leuciscus chuanchicus]